MNGNTPINYKNQTFKNLHMKQIIFHNGDKMPVLGLGTWKSAPGEVYKAVREAISLGYRHFDCAFIYGNEGEIGTAFSDAFKSGEVTREELWVTSKLWNNRHRHEQVVPALENTLNSLQLSYLDLYLIHWPVCLQVKSDFPPKGTDFIPLSEIPLATTWQGMEEAVKKRLTRHIGVANFNITNLKTISDGAAIKPEVNQVEMHPYLQQQALLDYCRQNGIHITAYSPLGSPDRPSRLKDGGEDMPILEDCVVNDIARLHGCSPAQILLSWAIMRGTSVIPKSVNPVRLRQNIEAAELELTSEDMKRLAALDKGHRYINGNLWLQHGSPYTHDFLWGD